jgi:hypothetical protein
MKDESGNVFFHPLSFILPDRAEDSHSSLAARSAMG